MKANQQKWLIRIPIYIVILGILFWTTNHRTVTVDSGHRMVMGTFVRIVVTTGNKKRAIEAINLAFEKIERIEAFMSDYDPDSQISQVNKKAFEQPVPVDAEVFEVLTAAKDYSALSYGTFDVTIGPMVQLWRKAKEQGTVPTPEQIQKARQSVGYKNLILDSEKGTVQFAKEGMFIDLGGIAKGYAIDKAIEILQDSGLKGAMVDIGGDLRCFGKPANGRDHWIIGLQDPSAEDEKVVLKLAIGDRAVATSGDYRRFVIIDGQKHSHIVDPKTAASARDLSSVSIIAPTATAADALATAVTVLGNEKGIELINKTENTETIIIPSGTTEFLKTPGADQYIQLQ